MPAKAIMFQGTALPVGKSVVRAAACRIFANDGNRVASFKCPNMSHYSFVTDEGGELGSAHGGGIEVNSRDRWLQEGALLRPAIAEHYPFSGHRQHLSPQRLQGADRQAVPGGEDRRRQSAGSK